MGFNLPSLNRRRRSGGFSPAVLFSAGEQGAWFDPSDFATLFQDVNGATSISAAGQTVGFASDKSKGLALGPELVTNGTFDTNTTGWVLAGTGASATVSGGVVTITAGSTTTTFQQTLVTVVGITYSVSITRAGGTSSAANTRPRVGGVTLSSPLIQTSATTTFLFSATATATQVGITLAGTAGDTVEINTISVKELPGNHARQGTAGSRPALRQTAGGAYYLEDDADNALNWAAPAGTYTVIFGDTAGTVTVETAQALSGTVDALRATQLVGYIAVNRGLTASEADAITNWLRARAGV